MTAGLGAHHEHSCCRNHRTSVQRSARTLGQVFGERDTIEARDHCALLRVSLVRFDRTGAQQRAYGKRQLAHTLLVKQYVTEVQTTSEDQDRHEYPGFPATVPGSRASNSFT